MNEKMKNYLNWSRENILKIKYMLNSAKRRNLSLKGKIAFLKMYVLSKVVYITQVVLCPDSVLKELDEMMFNFLWGSSTAKVRRTNVIKEPQYGGLEMIDLKLHFTSILLRWIVRFVDDTQGKWKWLFRFWLEKLGGPYIASVILSML